MLAVVLSGCSSKERLKGTREELFVIANDDFSLREIDKTPVMIDSHEEKNAEFLQAFLNPSHCYAPLHFSKSFHELWSSSLDFENSSALKISSAPVIAEGKVFCVDAAGIVYAFDKKNGKRLWRTSITIAGKDGQIGSAIAYCNRRIIVTSSFSEWFSLDAKTGRILKRIKLPAPCKGDGITIYNGKAFVMCSNSSLHVIEIETGKILWSHSGMMTDITFIGSSGVAVDNGVIYLVYPSGEIYALLEETGAVIWDAMLSKFSIINAAQAFSHSRACPVIKDGVVYFVSANEQTSAFSTKDGKLLWKTDFGGIQTPIVSGNSIFIFNSRSELVCLNKNDGQKRWVKKIEKNESEDWYGMILIKDHLLMVSPKGRVIFVSVYDGKIMKTVNINDEGDGISVNPVIADSRMYIQMNCGKITAYK
jgi:outer membrane protein assembly factor BamB